MKKSLSLEPKRTALLLVEFQEEQRSGPDYRVAGFDTVLANALRLLDAARRRRIAVFHAAFKRDFAVSPRRALEPVLSGGRPSFSDSTDPLTELCDEVRPHPGETLIVKNDASAFSEASLAPAVAAAGIEWLIIAGVWTEACVAASVRDAIAHGFRVLLVKDACGSGTQAMHEVAVLNIANRLYGGGITDTERALRLMAGETVETWLLERPVPILFSYENAGDHYARF